MAGAEKRIRRARDGIVATDFLDSNALLYLLSADEHKADRAEHLLRARPVISVQVLNEVTHVCRRKLRMDWAEIDEFLSLVRHFCKVIPLTEEIHDEARRLGAENSLSFYDACIVAAACKAGAQTLWSEDMQDGRQFARGPVIRNPFLSP